MIISAVPLIGVRHRLCLSPQTMLRSTHRHIAQPRSSPHTRATKERRGRRGTRKAAHLFSSVGDRHRTPTCVLCVRCCCRHRGGGADARPRRGAAPERAAAVRPPRIGGGRRGKEEEAGTQSQGTAARTKHPAWHVDLGFRGHHLSYKQRWKVGLTWVF